MKTIIKKPLVALLLLAISAVLLIIIWRISINWPLDTSWEEYKRINTLTERYGDELFEVVERYESRYTLTGYVDKEEATFYVVKKKAEDVREAWDAIVENGQSVNVATRIVSLQVVSHTAKTAAVVAKVYKMKVRYGSNGPEIIDRVEQPRMLGYFLEFEDGRWKVSWVGRCSFSDGECIRSMKHIKDKWYHNIIE